MKPSVSGRDAESFANIVVFDALGTSLIKEWAILFIFCSFMEFPQSRISKYAFYLL